MQVSIRVLAREITREPNIAAAAIRLYQLAVPVRFKGHCRNVPHCSEYGLARCRELGWWTGAGLAVFHVMNCGRLASLSQVQPGPCSTVEICPCNDPSCSDIHLTDCEDCGPAGIGECTDCTFPTDDFSSC